MMNPETFRCLISADKKYAMPSLQVFSKFTPCPNPHHPFLTSPTICSVFLLI